MSSSPMPPLGLEDFIVGPPGRTESYPFSPGDRLLLHTDGVIEARNRDNDFFALPEAVEKVRPGSPQEFLEELHQGLLRHTESCLADDVAMVLVERVDDGAAERTGPAATAADERRH